MNEGHEDQLNEEPAGDAATEPAPVTQNPPEATTPMSAPGSNGGRWASLDRTTKGFGIAALILFVIAAALGVAVFTRGGRSAASFSADRARAVRPFGPGMAGRRGGMMRGFRTTGLDVAAKTIGISQSDLRSQLRSGKSIADVAKAHKVDPQTVISALVDAESKQIDAAVKDGRIPPALATRIQASLKEMVTARVNAPGIARMGPGPGMQGGEGDDDGGPLTPPVLSPSATG